MQALRRQFLDSFRAFQGIYRNPSLRRLQVAWIGSSIGTWGYVVALMVYAYAHGGPGAVGLVGLIRWFPAAIVAPFGGMLGDRFPRLRVMIGSDLVRMTALAIAAVTIALGAPAVIVYLLAIVVTGVSQVYQPAQAALLPNLAESPEELAASNVAASTIESVGYFLGPALGGVILAASNVETVFALTATAFLWSACMLILIRKHAVDTLEALHKWGTYDRIIVVAHSLGTVVAYDMLRTYFSRVNNGLPSSRLLEPEFSDIDEFDLRKPSGPIRTEYEYRLAGRELIRKIAAHTVNSAVESDHQRPTWLVTDFVTLGSPLTHAHYLMCDGRNDAELAANFQGRATQREFPTCPPEPQDGDGLLGISSRCAVWHDALDQSVFSDEADVLGRCDRRTVEKSLRSIHQRHESLYP